MARRRRYDPREGTLDPTEPLHAAPEPIGYVETIKQTFPFGINPAVDLDAYLAAMRGAMFDAHRLETARAGRGVAAGRSRSLRRV